MKSLSCVQLVVTLWTAAHQAPPSMGFSRQESGLLQKGNVYIYWASLVSQKVKNLPTMRETWALSLGWEDPLKKGTVPDSTQLQYSCLEYCQGQKNLAGEQPMGSQKVR